MMQHMATYSSSNITTELIQKYLDENKQLILAILDNQNLGKLNECATYQAKLQQNLMYLAAIADAQPQGGQSSQMQAPAPTMQPSQQYMQQQQQQINMMNQRNAMMPSYLQQQNSQQSFYSQQQHNLMSGGMHMMHSHERGGMGGNNGSHQASPGGGGGYSDRELSMAMHAEAAAMQHHGGNGTGDLGGCGSPHQGNEDSEASYLKGSDGSSL